MEIITEFRADPRALVTHCAVFDSDSLDTSLFPFFLYLTNVGCRGVRFVTVTLVRNLRYRMGVDGESRRGRARYGRQTAVLVLQLQATPACGSRGCVTPRKRCSYGVKVVQLRTVASAVCFTVDSCCELVCR
jgi:hypothetical protein